MGFSSDAGIETVARGDGTDLPKGIGWVMKSTWATMIGLAGLLAAATQSRGETPATAAAPKAASAPAAAEKLSPEAEIRQLERERLDLLRGIRQANDQASQERVRAIQADPEMAALREKVVGLERELKVARDALTAKMKASGLGGARAPKASLEGMERMRQIDARIRELMGQMAKPKAVPAAPAQAAGGAPVKPPETVGTVPAKK